MDVMKYKNSCNEIKEFMQWNLKMHVMKFKDTCNEIWGYM